MWGNIWFPLLCSFVYFSASSWFCFPRFSTLSRSVSIAVFLSLPIPFSVHNFFYDSLAFSSFPFSYRHIFLSPSRFTSFSAPPRCTLYIFLSPILDDFITPFPFLGSFRFFVLSRISPFPWLYLGIHPQSGSSALFLNTLTMSFCVCLFNLFTIQISIHNTLLINTTFICIKI